MPLGTARVSRALIGPHTVVVCGYRSIDVRLGGDTAYASTKIRKTHDLKCEVNQYRVPRIRREQTRERDTTPHTYINHFVAAGRLGMINPWRRAWVSGEWVDGRSLLELRFQHSCNKTGNSREGRFRETHTHPPSGSTNMRSVCESPNQSATTEIVDDDGEARQAHTTGTVARTSGGLCPRTRSTVALPVRVSAA